VIVSPVYQVARKLLAFPALLLRRDAAKDPELLVLRHENAVPRRQHTRPVRYEPADRLRFAALSSLIPHCRWANLFPATLLRLAKENPAVALPTDPGRTRPARTPGRLDNGLGVSMPKSNRFRHRRSRGEDPVVA